MAAVAVAAALALGWLLPLGTGAIVFTVLAGLVAVLTSRPRPCPDCWAGLVGGVECASCDGTVVTVRPLPVPTQRNSLAR